VRGARAIALAAALLPAAAAAGPGAREEARWFAAVVRGDVAAVRAQARAREALLERWNTPQDDTALMIAANRCDLPMVKALLALGADPNAAPHVRCRTTPLSMVLSGAVYGRREKTVAEMNATLAALLDAGARPDASYVPGEFQPRTSAVLDAAGLDPSTLAVLLARRPDLTARDGQGVTAALRALLSAERGYADEDVRGKVEALLAAGHPLPSSDGERVQWLAAAWLRRLERTDALLAARGVTLPAPAPHAGLLLAAAASSGWVEKLELVLAQRPALGDPELQGVLATALAWAGEGLAAHPDRRPEVERAAARLLEAGASPTGAGAGGRTPLHEAAQLGWADLLERLATLPGVRLDAADAAGRTALHLAAGEGRTELVALLLRRGAAPGLPDREGDSPVVTAARALQAPALAQLAAAAPAERPRALAAIVDLACGSARQGQRVEGARIAAALRVLTGGAALPDPLAERLRACAPAAVRQLAPPQPALGPGEAAEALLLRAPEAELPPWRESWGRLEAGIAPWLELAPGLPRPATAAEGGEAPALLVGVCRKGEGVTAERWLHALLPAVERRPVAWSGPLACPAAVTPLGPSLVVRHRASWAPGYQAGVIAPAPAGTEKRGFVALTVGAGGALTGFGVGDDGGFGAGCFEDYAEDVDLSADGGTFRLSCGPRHRRWTVRREGERLVFRRGR
jgi:hypothetical protein